MTVGVYLLFLTSTSSYPAQYLTHSRYSKNSYWMNEYNKGYDNTLPHVKSQSNKGTKRWPACSDTLWQCLTRDMNTVVGEEEEGVENLA